MKGLVIIITLFLASSLEALSLEALSVPIQNESKVILDKVAERYFAHDNVELHFSLAIQIAERPKSNETGRIIQSTEKFKVEMNDQDIYCNGTSLWYHIKGRNEVQINDYEGGEDVGIISPADLLRQYESGEYEYALMPNNKPGSNIRDIEFKPNDDFSDYSKLRVTIDTNKNAITEVHAFGKDGSKFSMKIEKELFDLKYDAGFFEFDPKDHPDVNVEDLRLD